MWEFCAVYCAERCDANGWPAAHCERLPLQTQIAFVRRKMVAQGIK
jgi:hypothetical protein